MPRDASASSAALQGDIGVLTTEIGNLGIQKDALVRSIYLERNQFSEEKKNLQAQVDSLGKVIKALQGEVSRLEFLIIEKNLEFTASVKTTDESKNYIAYLNSIIQEIQGKINLLASEIEPLELSKQTLAKLNEAISFARVELLAVHEDMLRLAPERVEFEEEKKSFFVEQEKLEQDKLSFAQAAETMLRERDAVRLREENVSRIELSQISRFGKSTLKIISEKLQNGV